MATIRIQNIYFRPNDNKTLTKIRLWACEAAQLTSSQKTRTHNNVEASEFDMYRLMLNLKMEVFNSEM